MLCCQYFMDWDLLHVHRYTLYMCVCTCIHVHDVSMCLYLRDIYFKAFLSGLFPVLDIEEHASACQGDDEATFAATVVTSVRGSVTSQCPSSGRTVVLQDEPVETQYHPAEMGQCPVCSKHLPLAVIPGHVDICLLNSSLS